MNIRLVGHIKIKKQLKSKGDICVDIDEDGRVSISGYLYPNDGKSYQNQLQFLDETVVELTAIVNQLHEGIPVKLERKWYEFWKIKIGD